VCTVRPTENDGIQHNFTREAFTSVPNYTRTLGRALEVVPAGAAASGSSAPAPTATGSAPVAAAPAASPNLASTAGEKAAPRPASARESFRAAIQVTVR
jgi:hypothetical protein